MFGGVHPSQWGDDGGTGYAWEISSDRNIQRTLFNKKIVGVCPLLLHDAVLSILHASAPCAADLGLMLSSTYLCACTVTVKYRL